MAMERAQHAVIDPLIEPDPSDETGLNTHFRSTFGPQEQITPPEPLHSPSDLSAAHFRPQHTGSTVETNPYRRSRASSEAKAPPVSRHAPSTPRSSRHHEYPSPPNSASPRRERVSTSHRSEAFGSIKEGRTRRSSNPGPPTSYHNNSNNSSISRRSSLRERYPGDKSHMPLDQLRKDEKTAYRAPHLRKKNFQGADIIDRLDSSGLSQYHHEGPFDAANIARNRAVKYSPIAAVKESNAEALRATPRENIIDAVTRHRPLEGVANISSGIPDRFGRVLNYQEGTDLQRDELSGGDYRRVPGVEYHPNDLKGKGEPSFTIDKALKDHKRLGDNGIELRTHRHHSKSVSHVEGPQSIPRESLDANTGAIGRSNTTGKSMGGTLRKRFGSLRRRKQEVEA